MNNRSLAVNLISMCDIGDSPTTLFATYPCFQWWCQGWCGILHFHVAKEHLAHIHHCHRPQNARKMKVVQCPGNQRTGYVHHHLSFSTHVWHMIYPSTKLYNFFCGHSHSHFKPKSSPKSTTIMITNPDSHPCSPISWCPTTSSSSTLCICHTSLGDCPPPLTIPIASSLADKPLTWSQSQPWSAATTGTHLMITSLVMPQMMSEAKGKGKNKFGEGDSYLDMDEASVSMSHFLPHLHKLPQFLLNYPILLHLFHHHYQNLHHLSQLPPLNTLHRHMYAYTTSLESHFTNPHHSSFCLRGATTIMPPSTPSSLPPHHNHTYRDLSLNSPLQPAQTKLTVQCATSPSPPSSKEKDSKQWSATAPVSLFTPWFFSSSGSTVDHSIAGSPPLYSHITHLATVNPDSTSTLHMQTTHLNSHSHGYHRGINSSIHAIPPIPPLPSLLNIIHTQLPICWWSYNPP